MLWIGLLIGLFLGANIGIFFIGMCVSANKGDNLKKDF